MRAQGTDSSPHLEKGTPNIHPNEWKSGHNRDSCAMFITALFTVAKFWKQPRCPTTDEWINKLWCIYTMECYSATRDNDMGFEGKWMQLEDNMLSEVSQTQRDKGCMFSLIHGR
jgi:hypothetical protein